MTRSCLMTSFAQGNHHRYYHRINLDTPREKKSSLSPFLLIFFVEDTSHFVEMAQAEKEKEKETRRITGGCLCAKVRYAIDFPAELQWPPAVSSF